MPAMKEGGDRKNGVSCSSGDICNGLMPVEAKLLAAIQEDLGAENDVRRHRVLGRDGRTD